MAASIAQPGAAANAAPFPDDRWYKLQGWETQEGVVSCYRRGDNFVYKLAHQEFTRRLACTMPPNDYMEFLEYSMPVFSGDIVRFVSPESVDIAVPSRVDPTKMITHKKWGVTLVSDKGRYCDEREINLTQKSARASNAVLNFFGHAYIQIEMLNEMGDLESYQAHLTIYEENRNRIPNQRARVTYGQGTMRPGSKNTGVIRRPFHLVLQLTEDVARQVRMCQDAKATGEPYPIRFSASSPRPEEAIHNCLTWSDLSLRIAEIVIPFPKLPIPTGDRRRVPQYHVQKIKDYAKDAVSDGIDLGEYLTQEEIISTQEDEEKLEKEKSLLKEIAVCGTGMTVATIVCPAGWFVAPFLVIGTPILSAGQGIVVNSLERSLRRKKIRYIEQSILKEEE